MEVTDKNSYEEEGSELLTHPSPPTNAKLTAMFEEMELRDVAPQLGVNFTELFKKVNFNKKDFYEAIQPVTDHYRGITDSGQPHRPTPPLLDISKKWETDELYSTDLNIRSNKYLEHINAVDDLFTLLYSFKGVLDRYPPGADYSTPGLKTTFELLWGEVWAYYVTIPRVTFSWVYWDILHCIKEATGKDWTGHIEEEGEPARLIAPESIIPEVKEEPIQEKKDELLEAFGLKFKVDPTRLKPPTTPVVLPVVVVVPGGDQGGLGDGFIYGGEDNPTAAKQLRKNLLKVIPTILDPSKTQTKPRDIPDIDSTVEAERKLRELIVKAEQEIPDLRPLNEWSDALTAYTKKTSQHLHPLKKLILSRFMEIHKLPDVFQEEEEVLISCYYQALIAVNYGDFFRNIESIPKLQPSAKEIRYPVRQLENTKFPAIYYLFKDNRFDVDYNFIPAVSDAVKIEVFIKEYFPSYVEMLIGGTKITNIDDSWKVFKGVYTHFQSQKIQKDMEDKIDKAEPRLVIDELTSLIEGPAKPINFYR